MVERDQPVAIRRAVACNCCFVGDNREFHSVVAEASRETVVRCTNPLDCLIVGGSCLEACLRWVVADSPSEGYILQESSSLNWKAFVGSTVPLDW